MFLSPAARRGRTAGRMIPVSYTHLDVYKRQVKLDANENPYGPPPGALAALAAGRSYHIYPCLLYTSGRGALLVVPHDQGGEGGDEKADQEHRANGLHESSPLLIEDLRPTSGRGTQRNAE